MQDAVAKRFRERQDPHFDFGEPDLFDQLSYFLRLRGVPDASIASQVACLRLVPEGAGEMGVPTPIPEATENATSDEEEENISKISPPGMFG